MRIFYKSLVIAIFIACSIAGHAGSSLSFCYPVPEAKFTSLNGSISNNKVILEWRIEENQSADQFEVEKSEDGKNFVTAALVFGTDKSESDQYQFYEKATGKKLVYRIKLINKDQQISYSALIEINPENKKN